MRKVLFITLFLLFAALPTSAAELAPPEVPYSGAMYMPKERTSFGEGIFELLSNVLPAVRPDLAEVSRVCCALLASVMLLSILDILCDKTSKIVAMTGTAAISVMLFQSTHSLILMSSNTIQELSEYAKLLLPVLTAAFAAQGYTASAAALYTGTAVFNTILGRLISGIVLPMVYVFLILAVSANALGNSELGKMKDMVKDAIIWCMKKLMMLFTGYIGITKVISGSTDEGLLKAAKLTISSMVPVVGGILSNASEAVLVGASLVKNSIGIYGIFAVLAVFLSPFVQVGIHYLALKATASICAIFGSKSISTMIDDFSSAMQLLLSATGSMCFFLIISCICFLKGSGP